MATKLRRKIPFFFTQKYTPVQYLQATDKACLIETDIYLESTDRIEIEYSDFIRVPTIDSFLFGTDSDPDNILGATWFDIATSVYCRFCSTGSPTITYSTDYESGTLVIDSTGFYHNGVLIAQPVVSQPVNKPISIFGKLRNAVFEDTIGAQVKISSFKIYRSDNTPKAILVPTLELGFYDLITQQFYGNSGTGTLVAGPIIT